MFVPDPVISLSIKTVEKETMVFSRALNRFQREDPTFRVSTNSESGETIISGMGELHLEIYVERLKREYGIECIVGKPQVNYRETIRKRAEFNYTHKKQSGGPGQFARVAGYVEAMPGNENGGANEFVNKVVGGRIAEEYFPACEKGFQDGIDHGFLIYQPIVGTKLVLEDGAMHHVDSSEIAFRACMHYAFREAFKNARPCILEPVMSVQVTAPVDAQGTIIGGLNKRRAVIYDTDIHSEEFTVTCDVTLNEMFGYSTELRSCTQGKGMCRINYPSNLRVLYHGIQTIPTLHRI
jgi:elongation factor G